MKLYKLKKAFGGHAEGDVIELDPEAFTTRGLLETQHIAEAPGLEEALLTKAIEKMTDVLSASVRQSTAAAVETASKALSRGPRIDILSNEADKTKSFRDFIYNLGISSLSEAQPDERIAARDRLEKVYGARYNTWSKEIVAKAALADGSGVTGGYTTAPEFSQELLRIAMEDSVLAQRARIIPMSGPEIHFPALDQTTPTGVAGQTAYTGGMIAYWTGEAATRQETEPKFKSVILKANELSGYTLASRNLLRDNIVALETLLTELIRDTVAWYVDYGIIAGTGVGMPLGVLNAPATVKVLRTSANKFQLADAAKMMGTLLPRSRRKAVWLMAPDLFQQLVQLADSSGRVVFLPNMVLNPDRGSAQVAPDDNMILFGRPVYFTEKLPPLGTTGDVMLVDPSMILVGQRMELEIAASEHYKFVNNQMTWRFVTRVDAQPWMDKPLALQDQSRQLSPYVVLQ